VVSVAVPEDEVVRQECPNLRIIPDELATAVDRLLGGMGRWPKHRANTAAHLCSPFLRCGLCGGGMSVNGGNGRGQSYVCTALLQTKKGLGCGYKAKERVDEAVLGLIAPLIGDGC
jgi:hypothetical protein